MRCCATSSSTFSTQGSGTQIFSTTFVQWAAREVLRRARPHTLVLRYAPRQAERPMNDLVLASAAEEQLDPHGSLIDADMGAYYTWLNLTRLPGAEKSRFIACHEGGSEAIAIAPTLAAGHQFQPGMHAATGSAMDGIITWWHRIFIIH